MKRFFRGLPLLLLPALLLTGCDSNGSGDPEIGGTYTGSSTVTEDGTTITARTEIDIEDTDGGTFDFDGTTRLTFDSSTFTTDFSGTGTYTFPSIALTATVEGETSTITGTVSDDGDTLTLTSEGTTQVLTRD